MSRGQSTSPNISSIDKSGNTMALPKLKARHGIVRKPVIASLAGTTKAVSLSQRPQPPAKPRSERPLSAGGSYKPYTLAQQVSGEEMKNLSNQQSTFYGGQNRPESGSCNDNEVSGSVNSAQNGHKRAQRGKSEKFSPKRENTAAPRVSKHSSSQSHTSSAGSSTIQSIKSTSELLNEARLIAGPELPDEVVQKRAPNETLADTLVMGPTQRDTSVPKEKCSPRPMCHPPVSSGVYKMAESVLQKDSDIGSDGGGLEDLLSQVTNEDIIMARGCSLTPVRRPERTSHQTKTIQGLSLLATWTPKKEYKIFSDV